MRVAQGHERLVLVRAEEIGDHEKIEANRERGNRNSSSVEIQRNSPQIIQLLRAGDAVPRIAYRGLAGSNRMRQVRKGDEELEEGGGKRKTDVTIKNFNEVRRTGERLAVLAREFGQDLSRRQ